MTTPSDPKTTKSDQQPDHDPAPTIPTQATAPALATPDTQPQTQLQTKIKTNLQTLNANLSLLSSTQISSPSLVLHPADRDLTTPSRPPIIGLAAAQAHEDALLAATHGTLVMDVESINVGSDGVFACVMGVLRASRACSRSRFRSGSGVGRQVGVEVGVGEGLDSGGGGRGKDGDGVYEEDSGDAVEGDKRAAGRGHGEEVKDSELGGSDMERGLEEGERRRGVEDRSTIEMPFCGLWRFDAEGRAVEHWENAADPAALGRWLSGE